jgi:hypothetical protein
MRTWVESLGDEPAEGTSPEDWQFFRRRSAEVASQAERLLEHGWSLRGLFGWPSGLIAQAYSRRATFSGLYPDGKVQLTTGSGAKVTVNPINETTERCPWE